MSSLEFLPPHSFGDLEPRIFDSERSPGASNIATGRPYDLIHDTPLSSYNPVTTRYARGGAVFYGSAGPPGETYPTIERGLLYTVDQDKVANQSFWGTNSQNYFQTLVNQQEASIWGYSNDANENFKIRAAEGVARFDLWLQDKNAYVIVEPVVHEGEGLIAEFRPILGADLTLRYFLCTNVPGEGETPTCEQLPDPLVKNIYAQYIGAHWPGGPCVRTETFVDFAKGFLQVAGENSGAARVTIEPDILWVSKSEGSVSIESDSVKVQSFAGQSVLTDVELRVAQPNQGTYAHLDSAGWLEMQDSEGRKIYLDPVKLVFSDASGATATHDASGFWATKGNAYAALNGAGWLELRDSANRKIYLDPLQMVFQDGIEVSAIRASGLETSNDWGELSLTGRNIWFSASDSDRQTTITPGEVRLSGSGSLAGEGGTGVYGRASVFISTAQGSASLAPAALNVTYSGGYSMLSGEGWLEMANSQGKKIYLDPDKITFWDKFGNTSEHNARGLKVTASGEASELTSGFLHIQTGGSYASIDGSGWLELKNSSGLQLYLDPVKIVFTSGNQTAQLNYEGVTAKSPTYDAFYRADEAALVTSGNEANFRSDSVSLRQTSGGAYAELSVNSGSGTLELGNTQDNKGVYQATSLRLEDSIGFCDLTTGFLQLQKGSAYASINGSGWLELNDSANKKVYLDGVQIAFTEGDKVATHNANGFSATEGFGFIADYTAQGASLTSNGASANLSGDGFVHVQTMGGYGTYQSGWLEVSSGGGKVYIAPPNGKSAFFYPVVYVGGGGLLKRRSFLCTEEESLSDEVDPCTPIIDCVQNSKIWPTWTEANQAYVGWNVFNSYTQTVASYFSSLQTDLMAVVNFLSGLGVKATCSNGEVTVELTGNSLPTIGGGGDFPTGPWGPPNA